MRNQKIEQSDSLFKETSKVVMKLYFKGKKLVFLISSIFSRQAKVSAKINATAFLVESFGE
jgi:hypothetical protein